MNVTYLLIEKGKDTRVKYFEMLCGISNNANMKKITKSSLSMSINEDDILDFDDSFFEKKYYQLKH